MGAKPNTLALALALGLAAAARAQAPAAASPPAPASSPPPAPAAPVAPAPAPAAPAPGAPAPTPAELPRGAPAESRPAPPPAAQRRAQAAEEAGLAGDLRTALFAWQEATNLDPRNALYRIKLAEVYERLGYWDQAARAFELAAALDPPGTAALRRAEQARAVRDGKAAPPEPVRPVRATSADTPAAPAYEAGVAFIAKGQYAEAVASLDDAIRLDPRLAVAFTARAGALFGLGRYLESAGDYRTSLTLDPSPATPLFGMAECHRLLGQSAAAAEYYERYLRSPASDAREDLRAEAQKRLAELRKP